MQEIEIKFKVENLNEVKNQLISLGCKFSKELNQKDTIFVSNLEEISSGVEGEIFIRIRNVNGTNELNLKKQSSKILQSKEIEFNISDFNSAVDFIDTLGYKKWVTVEKKRITTKYKNFNICIDEVNRLGSFVEIEIVTEEENKTDEYEKEIIKVAEELNINTNNRINNFYDTMIWELDNK